VAFFCKKYPHVSERVLTSLTFFFPSFAIPAERQYGLFRQPMQFWKRFNSEIETSFDVEILFLMNITDSFFLVGRTEIEAIKNCQFEILKKLNELDKNNKNLDVLDSPYITALEFMKAVRIRRWKFNCLVKSGKIMTVKKKRKIYVPKEEIERYFADISV
jgi:hypothetical protein